MKITLEPKEEAAMIAYIVFYDHCKKRDCWKTIEKIIEKYGKKTKKIVYRGHQRKDKIIKKITPFFSTTPCKKMAELFVESEYDPVLDDIVGKIGNLFKLHLCNVKTINTSHINYTLSREVIEEIRKFIGKNAKIYKGEGIYTFDEFIPRIKNTLYSLVFDRTNYNCDEILVLNEGKFYKNKSLTKRGYNSTITKKGYTLREAWYKI
jgi:hypothetical protein